MLTLSGGFFPETFPEQTFFKKNSRLRSDAISIQKLDLQVSVLFITRVALLIHICEYAEF